MRPGHFSRTCHGLALKHSRRVLSAWLNEDCQRSAPAPAVVVAHVFQFHSDTRLTVYPRSVSHTQVPNQAPACTPVSEGGKPESDFPLCRLRRIRAVHQIELGLKAQIAANRSRRRLLDRIGPTSELAERRDRTGAFQHGGDNRSGGDELQKRAEERLLSVLRVMRGGQLLIDVLEFQRNDVEALALDSVDDVADQPPLNAVRLDKYQSPFRHGRQRTGDEPTLPYPSLFERDRCPGNSPRR